MHMDMEQADVPGTGGIGALHGHTNGGGTHHGSDAVFRKIIVVGNGLVCRRKNEQSVAGQPPDAT